jgi:hypothetical protein
MFKLIKRKKNEVTHYVTPDCLNCGQPLTPADKFCSNCGQKNVEKLSFSGFLNQIISGFFSYDSRFWNTFIPLIFKPGEVSKNYIKGKRMRYVNPFQMYLHVSILFFLLLSWTNKSEYKFNPKINNPEVLDSLLVTGNVEVDSINNKLITGFGNGLKVPNILLDSVYNIESKKDAIEFIPLSEKLEDFYSFSKKNPTISDTQLGLKTLGYPINFWNEFYFTQAFRFKNNFEQIENGNFTEIIKKILSYLSIGLFIFLPLFALSLNLFYIRKRMNYMEHLVFVFHTQTVFFLLLFFSNILGLVSSYSHVWIFLSLFLIYIFIALKTFYQQGIFKTFVKFILLNSVYSGLGFLALIITAIIAFVLG